MKKLIAIFILCGTLKSNSQTLLEVAKVLSGNKDENSKNEQKIVYKNVLNEVFTINSSSNETFKRGNARQAIKIKLPYGTIKWYYRITPFDVRGNYSYKENEELFSLLSNDNPLFVNNQISKGLDFYIINDYAEEDFYAKRRFENYSDFTKQKTNGFYGESNLVYNNLMICLINPNLKDGLKVIVEVVAYGNF